MKKLTEKEAKEDGVKMSKIAKKKGMLVGHTKNYDIYEDSKGNIYEYHGKTKKQFYDNRYWIDVSHHPRKWESPKIEKRKKYQLYITSPVRYGQITRYVYEYSNKKTALKAKRYEEKLGRKAKLKKMV